MVMACILNTVINLGSSMSKAWGQSVCATAFFRGTNPRKQEKKGSDMGKGSQDQGELPNGHHLVSSITDWPWGYSLLRDEREGG